MKKGVKQSSIVVAGIEIPKSEKHKKFCQEFAKTNNPELACKAAGFKASYSKAQYWKPLLIRYDKYIQRLMATKERAVAKELVLDQKDILKEMLAVAMADPLNYVEETMVTDDEGKLVRALKQKDITKLTREERASITKIRFVNGGVEYDLVSEGAKHTYLKDLGQHLGLFHQKLIAEHRHQHTHNLNFQGVSPDKLAELEAQALAVLGNEGKRLLGIPIDVEFEDVTPEA